MSDDCHCCCDEDDGSGFSKLVLQSVYSLSCVAPEICVLLAWWLPCILPEFFKYLEAKKKKKKFFQSLQIGSVWVYILNS